MPLEISNDRLLNKLESIETKVDDIRITTAALVERDIASQRRIDTNEKRLRELDLKFYGVAAGFVALLGAQWQGLI